MLLEWHIAKSIHQKGKILREGEISAKEILTLINR